MKVTVAIDSFKGSMSTIQAGTAVKNGIKRVFPDAEVKVCPIADGGEGTVDAMVNALGGRLVNVNVHGPLGQPIESSYGYIDSTKTAVIEMAKASGLVLVEPEKRNPLYTTTYGVGELIRDAIEKGCRSFIVGIGGSATNDGGVGMLQALGFEFLDVDGNQVPFGAVGLKYIVKIDTSRAMKELKECTFSVACDVTNPLCGENGCSAVFAPQKGADRESIEYMDNWLRRYARLTKKIIPFSDEYTPGTGAAGGLGYAFMTYLNATLRSGIELVINATGVEDIIKASDYVVTGEGRLDGQSVMGKAPVGIAKLAKKYGKRVIGLSGCVTNDAYKCNEYGIDAFFPILKSPCTLDEAMNIENASKNLADTAEQVFRLVKSIE
ncbi:MAG: glycerate kinase [Ruminococcaceae bacterium]|nr:glycerate kinase [Oscillospiraceae bacterium]